MPSASATADIHGSQDSPSPDPATFIKGRLFRPAVGGISVEIHEPVNVLSTMLLAITGGPKDSKLHPIAAAALEHVRPFRDHPSLAWLKEFYRAENLHELYGHAAQLSGPMSFTPRSRLIPAYIAAFEPQRIKELPSRMAAFYDDAKLGTFRRARNSEYTLAAADVKDAIDTSRIDAFLADLYGPTKYNLIVVPVPTNPTFGGAMDAMSGWETFAFLFPPRITPDSPDPVSWSLDPQTTQVLVQHELSHAIVYDLMREHKSVVAALRPTLSSIPRDSAFARQFRDPDTRFAELLIRASSVSYMRRTQGDEEARRWMEDQMRRLGAHLIQDFFRALEQYLERRRWPDIHRFLDDLPAVLGV